MMHQNFDKPKHIRQKDEFLVLAKKNLDGRNYWPKHLRLNST